MFKIFHRGHKVQFNEDELKKQQDNNNNSSSNTNKRNSYFYTDNDDISESSNNKQVNNNNNNEERVKTNNLSVSSTNTKALNGGSGGGGHHQLPTKRYSSIQHLPKPSANNYEEESEHSDGLKEKLMNRYTNVTTLLMRSFRKAKIKKKKENEENKRKSSYDGEESAAIYRPINRDEIFNRNSPKILKQQDISKKNHLTIPAGDDDDDDDDNGEDDGNQDVDDDDEEEDASAVPVCIGVKVISDDFVNYPIKIDNAAIKSTPVAETKNQSLSKSSPISISSLSNTKNQNQTQVKTQVMTKNEPSSATSRSQTPIRTIYSHSKPQAPRPPDIKSSGVKLGCETLPRNTGSIQATLNQSTPSKALPQSSTASKCTPLIGERKKIFEVNGGNNTISSGISLNKIGYFNSLSKKTATDLAAEQKQNPKIAVSSIRGTKTFEKFTNGSTSMVLNGQNVLSKREKEQQQQPIHQSTNSIAGTSFTETNNKLSKTDKLTISSLNNSGEKKKPTVERKPTFTQQLQDMLEQYKKMGTSIKSTDKVTIEAKPVQKESPPSKPIQAITPQTTTKYGFSINNEKSGRQQPQVTPKSYRPRSDSISDSSASSTTMKVNDSGKQAVNGSKIPLSTYRITTAKTHQSQNDVKETVSKPAESSKYGILKSTKDAKEIYLRSISKNSAQSLNDKINNQLKSPDVFFRSAITDTEVDKNNNNNNSDIYTSLKFPESMSDQKSAAASSSSKMFSQRFYGDMKNKMKKESYIKAASDFDDNRFINGKKNYEISDDDGIIETRRKIDKLIKQQQNFDIDRESKAGSTSTSSSSKSNDDFKSLVNVLEKQDNDFKYKFFNCLMPKLWDASLPYEEYVQLNKLMTALFGERYHELDQSTRNLAEELRRKSSYNKYELKEQFQKSQAYEANIKLLIKEYLKSPSKQTLDEFDFESMSVYNDIFDDADDNSSYKSVNHLLNTLRRRQLKDYSYHQKGPTKLSRTDSTNSRRLSKESSRSDYESYSDNAYSRPYRLSSQQQHKSLFPNKHKKSTTEDLKSSLFLQLKEQEDVSEDTDYVSKQSDIWTQSFESSEKADGDRIYGTVNYRNKSIYHKSDRNDRSEELRDKLRNSLQNFNNQDELPKESLKDKIQAFNRLSMNLIDNKQGKPSSQVGYSPQTPRKHSSKRPSYPDIVIESTLEEKHDGPIITSFQPASILSSSKTSITDSKTSLLRSKSPSFLSNGGQRLQAYRPKLLTNQLIDPSLSSITQESTLISNSKNGFNDSMDISLSKVDDIMTRSITRISPRQQKYTQPDIISNYDSYNKQQQQQQHQKVYPKSPVLERSQLNGLKKALMKDNKMINDNDYEAFINRKKSELMEKELMNSFNEFYMNRELSNSNYNKSLPKNTKAVINEINSFKTNVYDKIDIYDALY